jgi:hypothetical protein
MLNLIKQHQKKTLEVKIEIMWWMILVQSKQIRMRINQLDH